MDDLRCIMTSVWDIGPAASGTLPLPNCLSYHRPIARKRLHLLLVSGLLPAIQKKQEQD